MHPIRLIPPLPLLLAVPFLHADDVVLQKSAAPHPVITLKDGQTLRGADPNAHPVVAGIILAKNTTVSGVDVAGSIKGGSGDLVIENSVIRDASDRAIDVDGAASVTIRNVRIANSTSRNGVSAATCAGSVQLTALAPCNAVVFLQNAGNVSLEKVVIDGSAQLGIAAENVTGLRMNDVEVKNAGNEPNESSVILRNASGEVVLTNCRFHDSAGRELHIENTKGDARVSIRQSTFSHAAAPSPGQALLAGVSGSANLTLSITGSTFSGGSANGVHATASDRGKLTLHVADSTFDRNGGAILTGVSGSAALDYALTGNTIRRSALAAINVTSSGSGTVRGTIAKNDVTGAQPCGGCSGIMLTAHMNGRMETTIDANKLQKLEGSAIRAIGGGAGDLRIAITGNIVTAPIHVQAGTLSKDTATVCADVRDNAGGAITIWNRFPGTKFKLAGFGGDGRNAAAVATWLGRANRGARGEAKLTTDPAGNAFAAGDRCVNP